MLDNPNSHKAALLLGSFKNAPPPAPIVVSPPPVAKKRAKPMKKLPFAHRKPFIVFGRVDRRDYIAAEITARFLEHSEQ